jgi:hypothetical protein
MNFEWPKIALIPKVHIIIILLDFLFLNIYAKEKIN